VLIVRCQNLRGRQITDPNGTKEFKTDAVCLHVLGRVADIDGKALRAQIGQIVGVTAGSGVEQARAVDALMKLFCETFRASYWCNSCRTFIDVAFTDPGYKADVVVSDSVDFSRIMNPRVSSRQMEVK
jgi:hypothetical protein